MMLIALSPPRYQLLYQIDDERPRLRHELSAPLAFAFRLFEGFLFITRDGLH